MESNATEVLGRCSLLGCQLLHRRGDNATDQLRSLGRTDREAIRFDDFIDLPGSLLKKLGALGVFVIRFPAGLLLGAPLQKMGNRSRLVEQLLAQHAHLSVTAAAKPDLAAFHRDHLNLQSAVSTNDDHGFAFSASDYQHVLLQSGGVGRHVKVDENNVDLRSESVSPAGRAQ